MGQRNQSEDTGQCVLRDMGVILWLQQRQRRGDSTPHPHLGPALAVG